MNEPSRKLAATALGVPIDADANAVRAAFLKKLATVQFVPPGEWLAAVNLLNGATLPLTPDAMIALAEIEKADVDDFRAQYWALPPAERQQRWNALDKRCHDADVRDTLHRLKDGLKVVVKIHDDPTMQTMAEFIREIYLLPIRSRAIRRMEWCVDQPRETVLYAIASQFQQVDPDTASIEQVLMNYLQSPKTIPIEVESLSRKSLDLLAAKREANSLNEQLQQRPVAKRPWYRRTIKFVFWPWIVIIAVSAMVRTCASNSNSRSSAVPSNPSFEMKKLNRDIDGYRRDLERLTPRQFNDLLRYVPNSGKPPPLYYLSWTLLGKPFVQPKPSAMRP